MNDDRNSENIEKELREQEILNKDTEAKINSISLEDKIKYDFLFKIKARKYGLYFLSGIVFVIVVILFFSLEDKLMSLCIAFMGLMLPAISYIKYGKVRTIDDFVIIQAECINKGRSGYRKQYFEYTFEYDGNEHFLLKSAQKEKFKKNIKYNLCFAKGTDLSNETSLTSKLYYYNTSI